MGGGGWRWRGGDHPGLQHRPCGTGLERGTAQAAAITLSLTLALPLPLPLPLTPTQGLGSIAEKKPHKPKLTGLAQASFLLKP